MHTTIEIKVVLKYQFSNVENMMLILVACNPDIGSGPRALGDFVHTELQTDLVILSLSGLLSLRSSSVAGKSRYALTCIGN